MRKHKGYRLRNDIIHREYEVTVMPSGLHRIQEGGVTICYIVASEVKRLLLAKGYKQMRRAAKAA